MYRAFCFRVFQVRDDVSREFFPMLLILHFPGASSFLLCNPFNILKVLKFFFFSLFWQPKVDRVLFLLLSVVFFFGLSHLRVATLCFWKAHRSCGSKTCGRRERMKKGIVGVGVLFAWATVFLPTSYNSQLPKVFFFYMCSLHIWDLWVCHLRPLGLNPQILPTTRLEGRKIPTFKFPRRYYSGSNPGFGLSSESHAIIPQGLSHCVCLELLIVVSPF